MEVEGGGGGKGWDGRVQPPGGGTEPRGPPRASALCALARSPLGACQARRGPPSLSDVKGVINNQLGGSLRLL